MSDRLFYATYSILTNRLTRDLRIVMVLYALAQVAWGYVTLSSESMLAMPAYRYLEQPVGLLILLSAVPLGLGMAFRMPRTAFAGALAATLAWSICGMGFGQAGAWTGTVMYTLAAIVSTYGALRTIASWAVPRSPRPRPDPAPISI